MFFYGIWWSYHKFPAILETRDLQLRNLANNEPMTQLEAIFDNLKSQFRGSQSHQKSPKEIFSNHVKIQTSLSTSLVTLGHYQTEKTIKFRNHVVLISRMRNGNVTVKFILTPDCTKRATCWYDLSGLESNPSKSLHKKSFFVLLITFAISSPKIEIKWPSRAPLQGQQWCWWQRYVDNFMMVTVLRCWWQNHYIVTNINRLKHPSPTSI